MASNSNRNGTWLRLALFALTLFADQATKLWARHHFSLPSGEPDYFKAMPIVGEWLQFRLIYNYGAAFGMRPQELLPFLHPTVFYSLFSLVAIGVLFAYYRRLQPQEGWLKAGVLLILSGAAGNLIDRVSMHKVTDFIDVGLPNFQPRWPIFNVADSCVCVGVGLLLVVPMFLKKPEAAAQPSAPAQNPAPGKDAAEHA